MLSMMVKYGLVRLQRGMKMQDASSTYLHSDEVQRAAAIQSGI
ncbi:hypothetical protein BUC_2074 [Burkholderia pseudomallei 576]|nr:hypothetical protein BUC_2074 [Burkholderia pseudomallei 576]